MSSSASAGLPGMPSRLDHSPSCMWPPGARASSSQCWASTTPRAPGVLHGPAHEPVVLHAVAVVGEEAHAEAGQLGHRGQLLARAADRDGRRPDVAQRPSRPSSEDLPDHRRGESMAGSVLGMATTAVKPPRAAARVPVSTVSASSAGLAQVGVQVDEAGATTQPPASRRRSRDEVVADGGDPALLDDDVGDRAAGAVDHLARP